MYCGVNDCVEKFMFIFFFNLVCIFFCNVFFVLCVVYLVGLISYDLMGCGLEWGLLIKEVEVW